LCTKFGERENAVRFNWLIFILFLPCMAMSAEHMPTAQDIQQAKQKSSHKLSQFDADKVAVPSFPNMDKVMASSPHQKGDLTELFKRASQPKAFEKLTALPKPANKHQLIVFASFSIPEASLKKLLEQTSQAGGTVLMRGLVFSQGNDPKPSFLQTKLKTAALHMKKHEGFAIDPTIFQKYHIEQVPAFVIEDAGLDVVYGDVSLDYALHYMLEHAPKNKPLIQGYLSKLSHQGFFK